MKKQIIGTLVVALILFVWQFLSWGLINLHRPEQQYTEHQEKILTFLSENLTEGQYFLPTIPPGADMAQQEALQKNAMGNPWAQINYHPSFEMNMSMNLTRGFIVDVVSAFLLIWILLNFRELNSVKAIIGSVAVGLIGYLTITYLNHVWFQGYTLGFLLDCTVPWVIIGGFLGWYLPD